MSRFRFFALGGLGEIGKNMYILETDTQIFVLDCGSMTPSSEVNGYDSVIPDYSYVLDNINKVQGVFLTRFGEKSTGAFLRVIKDLKVPFYGSEFTIEAIRTRYLQDADPEDTEGLVFRVVQPGEIIDFGSAKIEFFSVTSNVPDTLGFALKINVAKDDDAPLYKNVVYLPDSDFDQNVWGHFKTDFHSLNRIADEGVIALLSSSTGADKMGHVTTDGKLDLALRKIMAHEGRTYCLMTAENVFGILQVIDAAYYQKRRITIIGHEARKLVELAMKLGYTRVNNDLYMPKQVLDDEKRNAPDTVVIIASDHEPDTFNFMQNIATFHDKHFVLTPKDNVVFLQETAKKYEKKLADTWNNILFIGAELLDFDTKLMPQPVDGAEDLKLMYSLLSPEYIVPISGDYRMIKAQVALALDYGYDEKHVVELDNGLFATFEDGVLKQSLDGIETKEILFGGQIDSDINDFVAREREALTQEGFLVISGMINLKEREIYGDIEIVSYGFLPEFGQEDELASIKQEFKTIVNTHLRLKKVDYKELRQDLKNDLSKKILRDTKKRPILIPVIVDVSV